jgi:lipid II:glycine glycyltransferase (peptidoglycan interpeptide bridge formation enzyme)
VRQGQDAIWLGLATDGDPQSARSYLLVWQAIRRARAMGLASYDLAGLSAEDESTGRDQFKQAFAPVREELLSAHVAALQPIRHAIFFPLRQLYRTRRKS